MISNILHEFHNKLLDLSRIYYSEKLLKFNIITRFLLTYIV